MTRRIVCVENSAVLADVSARTFVDRAVQAIETNGSFRVALAGGNTPRAVYARIATDTAFASRIDWRRVQFFFGDERHVPPEHRESNFRMAREALFDRLPIRADQICRIKGEYDDPSRAAREYEATLQQQFALLPGEWPRFDLVLLGMGPDGHTASLFPGIEALTERHRLVVSSWIKKFQTSRITLTMPVLNNADAVMFMVAGQDKAEAVATVLEDPPDPLRFPAQSIQPARGDLLWLIDRAAGAGLSESFLMEQQS